MFGKKKDEIDKEEYKLDIVKETRNMNTSQLIRLKLLMDYDADWYTIFDSQEELINEVKQHGGQEK